VNRNVKPSSIEKKHQRIIGSMSILPELLMMGSGCSVEYMRGTTKMSGGTATNAMIE
jgi:hypothetical protein